MRPFPYLDDVEEQDVEGGGAPLIAAPRFPAVPTQPEAPAPAVSPGIEEIRSLKAGLGPSDLIGRAQRRDTVLEGSDRMTDAIARAFGGTPLGQHRGSEADRAAQFVQARQHQADDDPASESSQTAREFVRGVLPDVVAKVGPVYDRLSARKLNELFPFARSLMAQRKGAEDPLAALKKQKLEAEIERLKQPRPEDPLLEDKKKLLGARTNAANALAGKHNRPPVPKPGKPGATNEDGSPAVGGNYLEGYELKPGVQPGKDELKAIRKAQASTRTIKDTIRELVNIYNHYGTQTLPTAAKARMKLLATDLRLAMKGPEQYQLGVLAGPDMELLSTVISDPTTSDATALDFVGGEQTIPRLVTLASQIDRKFENSARSLGFQRAGGGQKTTTPNASRMVTVRRKEDGATKTLSPDLALKYLSDPAYEKVQ